MTDRTQPETLTVLDLKDIADRARAMGVRETEARYAKLVAALGDMEMPRDRDGDCGECHQWTGTNGRIKHDDDCAWGRVQIALANLETTP